MKGLCVGIMKKNKLVLLLGILSIMLFACSSNKGLEKFKDNLKEQSDSQKISLESLTDFEWEKVYFIAPYTSKESIENILKIKSDEIYNNMVDEKVLYLIFTNKEQLVNQVYGRIEQLGFSFELGEYNECFELNKANAIFSVNTIDEIKTYTHIKK